MKQLRRKSAISQSQTVKDKKKVTVLNHFALPRSSPGATRHIEIFGLLDEWDTTILAGNRNMLDQSPVYSDGILKAVWTSPYSGNGASRVVNWASYCISASIELVRSPAPDVVYASSPHMGAAACGAVYAALYRRPLVVEVRDLWPQILVESQTISESSFLYRALKSLERRLYSRADKIVILAEGSRRAIEAEGVIRDKVYFVPNCADVGPAVSVPERERLRSKLGFDGFVVVYAGAHGPANGLSLVLDAAERLELSCPNVRFVLYGHGVAKESLIEEADRRGLRSVEFRDPVPKADIAEVFAAADAGLHCLADVDLFKYGVSPNKLYDYMAAGLPTITNAGGDTAEMVELAGAGVTCHPGAIDTAVAKLVATPESHRREYGRSGRKFMLAERSRSAMAGKIQTILESVER